MNPTDYPKKTAEVGRYIAKSGFKGVILNKGPGYFCFEGELTEDWINHTVEVPFLSHLSLDQWLQTFKAMNDNPSNRKSVLEASEARY